VVPESLSNVSDSRKAQHQHAAVKTGASRGGMRRSNSYTSTLKRTSNILTPASNSSFSCQSSTPVMLYASQDSLFFSEHGPDLSAIGPAPVLSKLQ